MIYYTGLVNWTRQTAAAKAPTDILTLCNERGYIFFPLVKPKDELPKLIKKMSKYIQAHLFWKKVINTMQSGDVLIYQHPLYASRVLSLSRYIDKLKKKGVRLIVLIHDIESLRKGIKGAVRYNKWATKMIEGKLLKRFDIVICHNQKMKQYLMSIGYQDDRLVCLELFDYLTDSSAIRTREKGKIPSVTVAGNLLKTKSGYIYHMHDDGYNSNLKIHLYGLNFEKENQNMVYHGSFPSDILPKKLEGDFGLIWDGNYAETCTGNTGEYLKYNNPHKTSLYLSAGMPVIVWDQAAIAEFVLKHKVGIAIKSLYEVEDKIRNISENDYLLMCENAKIISEKVRKGYYFFHALDNGLRILGMD